MRIWKLVGLAGLIGGVAVGVTVGVRRLQRAERPYVDADITELRARLRRRFAEIETETLPA